MKKFVIALCFILLAFTASQSQAQQQRHDVVDRSISTASTTPKVIMASNPARSWMLLYNPNATGVYLGFSVGSTVPSVTTAGVGGAGTIVLAPGGVFELDSGDTQNFPISNTINVVASAGTTNVVTAWER